MSKSTTTKRRILSIEGNGEPVYRRASGSTASAKIWVADQVGQPAHLTHSRCLIVDVDGDGAWTVGIRAAGPRAEPVTVAVGHIDDDPHQTEGVDVAGIMAVYDWRHTEEPAHVRTLVEALARELVRTRRQLREQQEATQRDTGEAPKQRDLAEAIRQMLAGGKDADAVAVEFPGDEWEDGWYYAECNAQVILPDGTVESYDLCEGAVFELVSELSAAQRDVGPLDKRSVLRVDLTTGEVTHTRRRTQETRR